MHHDRQTLPNFQRSLLLGGLLCLSLLATPAAVAGYKPPSRPSQPKTPTTTTGVRGICTQGLDLGLTVLAPLSHVGQTARSHPTVAWFIPDPQSYVLKFRLYRTEAGMTQGLVYETELPSQAGIMQLTLPETQPGLVAGQRYTWQVVMLCNPNSPSQAIVASAELEVVPPSSGLETPLAAKTAQAQATAYAESGLWYDALRVALQNASRPNQVAIALLNDLAMIEATVPSDRSNEHGQRLKTIISIL